MLSLISWIRVAASRIGAALICCGIAALAYAEPNRPVVLVPGILGSKLCRGQEVVWGTVSSLRNFRRLDLAVNDPEPIIQCGLLEEVSILGPFWKINAYKGLLDTLRKLGYKDDQTLFIFSYDWRLSNLDNAKLLDSFIERIGAPKVDIVAHSMGGIVSDIYIQSGGAKHVNKIIFLGTPFMGSMNSFATLSNGWGGFENIIAGGIDAIRRTALSLPAVYELLPRYDNCCRIGTREDYVPVDPMNPKAWRQYGWLPPEYASGSRSSYFETQLARAKQVQELLAKLL